MMHRPSRPAGRILLDLLPPEDPEDDPLRDNLSVATQRGRELWLASDETASLERLTTGDWTHFGNHRSYPLGDLLRFGEISGEEPGRKSGEKPGDKSGGKSGEKPGERTGEIDIEGLGIDGDHLWLVGSHSAARKRPKLGKQKPKEAIEQLRKINRSPYRHVLARIALGKDGAPISADRLDIDCKLGSTLTRAVRQDRQLEPFLAIPAKENGFDIEGLAVSGGRVFVGLRGPVLRGWAIILELQVEEAGEGRLGLGEADGAAYAKHFLDLDGLGIRELAFDSKDLLILAGPTMDLDGPVALWRWRDPLHHKAGTIVPRDSLEHVFDVPHGHGDDHAEGLCLFEVPDQPRRILVVYDSPGPKRCRGDHRVEADLFDLSG